MEIVALVMVALLGVQEAEDPKARLKAGLEASSKAGGFTFSGRLEQESAMPGMKIPGFSDGSLEGKFTGTLAANGTLHLKLETDKGVYELWRKGDKIVQRQTWTGRQDMVGAFPSEVSAVLSLSTLLRVADKMKEAKAGDVKAIDGVDCTPIKGKLPPSFVPEDDEDDSGMPVKMRIWELKKVEAAVYVGKDQLVRRIEVTLSKGLSSMVRMAGVPGGDEEKEEEAPGLGSLRMTSTYAVTIGAYDKEAKVAVPDDVKKHLGE